MTDAKEKYQAMLEKVRNESTIDGLWKLEKANSNLYDNGCLQGFEFRQIDLLILDKMVELKIEEKKPKTERLSNLTGMVRMRNFIVTWECDDGCLTDYTNAYSPKEAIQESTKYSKNVIDAEAEELTDEQWENI